MHTCVGNWPWVAMNGQGQPKSVLNLCYFKVPHYVHSLNTETETALDTGVIGIWHSDWLIWLWIKSKIKSITEWYQGQMLNHYHKSFTQSHWLSLLSLSLMTFPQLMVFLLHHMNPSDLLRCPMPMLWFTAEPSQKVPLIVSSKCISVAPWIWFGSELESFN